MANVTMLVDGFNLYHAIVRMAKAFPRYNAYKWLDLKEIAEALKWKSDVLAEVVYFTAMVPWDAAKSARHQLYLNVLGTEGIRIEHGRFRRVQKKCRGVCRQKYWTYEAVAEERHAAPAGRTDPQARLLGRLARAHQRILKCQMTTRPLRPAPTP